MRDPEQTGGSEISPAMIAMLLLFAAAAFVAIGNLQTRNARDELESERKRRRELQGKVKSRDEQLDGALAKISELAERVDKLSPS